MVTGDSGYDLNMQSDRKLTHNYCDNSHNVRKHRFDQYCKNKLAILTPEWLPWLQEIVVMI